MVKSLQMLRFSKVVLDRMRFPKRFIKCIMNCISSASFTLLLNGQISTDVEVRRGLRKSDPLSPYLFIFVLSCLVSDVESRNDCQGIKFARIGPSISHLHFADDLILFFSADNRLPYCLETILDDFCIQDGLSINV